MDGTESFQRSAKNVDRSAGARQADVQVGHFQQVRTVELIGRDRFLGTIVLRP